MNDLRHNPLLESLMADPFERLEKAYDEADSMADMPITIRQTLTELCRISSRGFTESEASYWADRLENLMEACR